MSDVHDDATAKAPMAGDSILGTLILARAAQAGVKFSPRQLFQYQTIAELTNAIR